MKAIAPGEITQVPEPESERTRLYAIRSGQQPLANEPKTPQAQISMQAHALVSLDRSVHAAYGDTDLPRKFFAVDRAPNVPRQYGLNIPINLKLPNGVRTGGPACVNQVGECGVDASKQGLPDRKRNINMDEAARTPLMAQSARIQQLIEAARKEAPHLFENDD